MVATARSSSAGVEREAEGALAKFQLLGADSLDDPECLRAKSLR